MKKWNLLLVLALLFVACKDEYDVNLDELYGTTSGSSSKVDKEIITCGDSKVHDCQYRQSLYDHSTI